jgi:hypothetical protein
MPLLQKGGQGWTPFHGAGSRRRCWHSASAHSVLRRPSLAEVAVDTAGADTAAAPDAPAALDAPGAALTMAPRAAPRSPGVRVVVSCRAPEEALRPATAGRASPRICPWCDSISSSPSTGPTGMPGRCGRDEHGRPPGAPSGWTVDTNGPLAISTDLPGGTWNRTSIPRTRLDIGSTSRPSIHPALQLACTHQSTWRRMAAEEQRWGVRRCLPGARAVGGSGRTPWIPDPPTVGASRQWPSIRSPRGITL